MKKIPVENDHKQMMSHPDQWPVWPVLPVKRYKQPGVFPVLGILLAVKSMQHTVFEVNMFEAVDLKSLVTDPAVTKHVYKGVDEILADGWVVD